MHNGYLFSNRYAEAVSRRISINEQHILPPLMRSVRDELTTNHYVLRLHLMDEPAFMHRQHLVKELYRPCPKIEVRIVCPPTDLFLRTPQKLRRNHALVGLIRPDCPRKPCNWKALDMADRVDRVLVELQCVWLSTHHVNPSLCALVQDVNLPREHYNRWQRVRFIWNLATLMLRASLGG